MTKVKATQVYDPREWQGKHGKMVTWTMYLVPADNPDATPALSEINAKPGTQYKAGDVFWVTKQDTRQTQKGNTIVKVKREKAPEGETDTVSRSSSGNGGSKEAMPFDEAVKLLNHCRSLVPDREHATTLFLSVLRGEISKPELSGAEGNPELDAPSFFDEHNPAPEEREDF